MFLGIPALHVVILPWSTLDYDIYPFLFYFVIYYHFLYWFYLLVLCSSLLPTSSHTCPYPLLHY